jgi:MFS family permease
MPLTETPQLSTPKPPQPLLHNRNFLLLFSGKIVSLLGDQIYAFALSWYVLDLTKSSFQMAVFLVINTLAIALVSPFGGIVADRCNRKSILVWMDLLQGAVVLAAAALVHQHLLHIWMLYLSALILGICGAIFSPAATAIIPNVVDEKQLGHASALNQLVTHACTMIGMLVSGALYAFAGILPVFLFNAASFFISAILEAALRLPSRQSAPATASPSLSHAASQALHDLQDGFRYVYSHRAIFYLLLMNTVFILIALPIGMVYIPYFFNVILNATPFQLALPQAAIWTGLILGSIATPLFLHRYKLKTLIFWSFSLLSIFTLFGIVSFFPNLVAALHATTWHLSLFWTATNLICGLFVSLFTIPMYVLFQKHISDDYRGRFWGFENSLRTAAMGLGFLLAGFLAQKIWLGYLFIAITVVMLAVNFWILNLRPIRDFHE